MPAMLTESQIDLYLHYELNEFGPSELPLEFTEAENFLKKKAPVKGPPPPSQGEFL